MAEAPQGRKRTLLSSETDEEQAPAKQMMIPAATQEAMRAAVINQFEQRKAHLDNIFKVCELINTARNMFREDVVRAIVLWSLQDPQVYNWMPSLIAQNELGRFATLFKNSATMSDEVRQVIAKAFEEIVNKPVKVQPAAAVRLPEVERPVVKTISLPSTLPISGAVSSLSSSNVQIRLRSGNSKVFENEVPYVPWVALGAVGDLHLILNGIEIELIGTNEIPIQAKISLGDEAALGFVNLTAIPQNQPRMTRFFFSRKDYVLTKTVKPSNGGSSYYLTLLTADGAKIGSPLKFRVTSLHTIKARNKTLA